MRLYTIGHSTRTLDEFVEALKSFGVRTLVDIRTVPRSRHVPQFNQDTLSQTLPKRGIRYRHFPGLGGLRKPRSDSQNTAWRNLSFRGFADYMETREFSDALDELRTLSQEAEPVAIMCAEAVPWRCHRSLVADALVARGDAVTHIMGPGKSNSHELTPWARVEGTRVMYPRPPPSASADAPASDRQRPTPSARSRSAQPSSSGARNPAARARTSSADPT